MSRHTRDDARRSMVLLIAGRRGEPLRKAGRDDSESERERSRVMKKKTDATRRRRKKESIKIR